ncbi:hypothetical protein CPB86DRAFT_93465 [Serendipita vermifera]|nr:hypothetical protein CPB86DRAFT_93465 [Serendipita vermifera]
MVNHSGGSVRSDDTLVDNIHFIFTHDDPTNTQILDPTGHVLYRVQTEGSGAGRTVITKDTGEHATTIHWSLMGFHKVALGTEKPCKTSKILHSGPLFSETVSFRDEDGRKFEWRACQTSHRRLELYATERSPHPIASFHRSKREHRTGVRHRAYLKIEPLGLEILDTLIWTFVFLEKGKRDMASISRRL